MILHNHKNTWQGTQRKRRRLWSRQDYKNRDTAIVTLYVFYYERKGDDILQDRKMESAHEIEQKIKNFEGYSDRILLSENDYSEIVPDSFLNYLFPTINNRQIIYNGNGESLCCDTKQIAFYLTSNYGIYKYFDYSFDKYRLKSKYMVSIFKFGYSNDDIDSNNGKKQI